MSGGDRHLLEMASRWNEHVELVVVAPPQAEEPFRRFLGDVSFVAVGSTGARQRAGGAGLAFDYVRRAAVVSAGRLPDSDVVIAASHFAPDATALRVGSRRGAVAVAYVYHLISARPQRDLRTVWSLNDERIGLALIRRHASLVFASNKETAGALHARGITSVHTGVGIDTSAFIPGDPSGRPPRVLFIARMVRMKGVLDAINAWPTVIQAMPAARLVMVGDGPERASAEAHAIRLGLEGSIEWPGFVTEGEKQTELQRARVFLAPSYEEGWGIAVCEALASSLPVVAYRLPTLDELFGTAYVGVPLGDSSALARATADLLLDDDRTRELSARARPVAELYDLDQIADQELEHILRATRS